MEKYIKLQMDTSAGKLIYDNGIVEKFKELFSGCNINFLLGAGFSADLLKPLGNKEHIFEAIKHSKAANNDEQIKLEIVSAYEYWDFFSKSICAINSLDFGSDAFLQYKAFSENIYQILADKSNPVLGKSTNFFTTNYDPIIEVSFDDSKTICNDGFEGRIHPVFSTSNYSKTYYREAFYSNRKAEIPTVNLIKVHGSITWAKDSVDRIIYEDYYSKIDKFSNNYKYMFDSTILGYINSQLVSDDEGVLTANIEHLIQSNYLDSLIANHNLYIDFLNSYHNSFLIVNPTKEKFSDTLLNKNYYEMLRMFSNEMEKENTLLCVIGFSFADEHIQDLLKRSMINPSLKVVVFCYEEKSTTSYDAIFSDLKNDNISYVFLEGEKLSLNYINELLSFIHI